MRSGRETTTRGVGLVLGLARQLPVVLLPCPPRPPRLLHRHGVRQVMTIALRVQQLELQPKAVAYL